jgi:hypothetical protein
MFDDMVDETEDSGTTPVDKSSSIEPAVTMSNLIMLFYTASDGIETRVRWKSDEEYGLVEEFLKKKGAVMSRVAVGDAGAYGSYFYIENEQLLDDLDEYVEKLRENGDA